MEDVAVAYGYNNIAPLWRELPTTGRAKPEQRIINLARDLMVGLGYQETLNNTLANPQNLFAKMNTQPTRIVEVTNPQVVTMTCLRNQLLPSLMEFLSVNPSVEFPQKIFELGKVTLIDETKETKTKDEDWIAAATTHATAGFSEAKSALDSFLSNLGINWQIKETCIRALLRAESAWSSWMALRSVLSVKLTPRCLRLGSLKILWRRLRLTSKE
jgi:phenylalanyl-tRNA synthetase beta chain